MSGVPILSLVILAPWAGAVLLLLWPRGAGGVRALALGSSLSTLVLAAVAWSSFRPELTGYQFVEARAWIPALHVEYHLGLDGLGLIFVLLTGVAAPAGLLGSGPAERDSRLYSGLYLLLQGSVLGVFLALDFVPWFLFWELSLAPAFFLIRLWGGPGATRAALQFVLMTVGGSAFLLVSFAALYVAAGTFDFAELTRLAAHGELAGKLASLGWFWPRLVFAGAALGLAVKVPLFPLHTWQPSAYAEAPTGVSMFLTAAVSKMGVYGFLRILWPIFPGQIHAAAPVLIWLALGSVVLGAFAAIRQTDLKRMVAYSSINHLGYCLLALFAVAAAGAPGPRSASALDGAILQAFNHALSAGALFFCVGMIESRTGTRGLNDFGGIRASAPVFAGLCGISMFSSLGLPGLNGFVGEFLILRGVFGLEPWAGALACLGLLATAIFLLGFWQRVFHGPPNPDLRPFPDVRPAETAVLVPSVALMFLFGVAPQILIGLFNPLVSSWVAGLPSP
jgi:NADH-quinone oxidoreductase subunit M